MRSGHKAQGPLRAFGVSSSFWKTGCEYQASARVRGGWRSLPNRTVYYSDYARRFPGIPSAGDVVRIIVASTDGCLHPAYCGVNKIGVLEIR